MFKSIISQNQFLTHNDRLVITPGIWEDPVKPGFKRYNRLLGILAYLFGKATRFKAFDQAGNQRIWFVNSTSLKLWKDRTSAHYKLGAQCSLTIDDLIHRVLQQRDQEPAFKVPRNETKEQANQFLNEMWKLYRTRIDPLPAKFDLLQWAHSVYFERMGRTTVLPERHARCNFMRDITFSPEAFLIPDANMAKAGNQFETNKINDPVAQERLVEIAKKAFEAGKKLVVGRYSNGRHTFVIALTDQGKLRVVDSMLSNPFDLKQLEDRLNQSGMEAAGKKIHFSGKVINTHLQKGGEQCVRFATLYAREIALRGEIKAYRLINGAFAEGTLKKFEDIHKLDQSKSLKDASNVSPQNYAPFMYSWLMRSAGSIYDSWEDVPLKELAHDNPSRWIIFQVNSQGIANPGYPSSVPPERALNHNQWQMHQNKTLGDLARLGGKWIIAIGPSEKMLAQLD